MAFLKYPELNSFLRKQYIDQKLGIAVIAGIWYISSATVYSRLKKLGIPIRSRSEGIHIATRNNCNLSKEAREFIDGELLGDMGLWARSKYSAHIVYSSKYKKYLEWLSKQLSDFGIKQAGKIYRYQSKIGIVYHYGSRGYPELYQIKGQFYPNGKKIVPKNVELTPLVCRQWYIGDGTLRTDVKTPRISIATCGFLPTEVILLKDKLNKLGFISTHQKARNVIGISAYSTKDFLKYIGQCPSEIRDIYGYKWGEA